MRIAAIIRSALRVIAVQARKDSGPEFFAEVMALGDKHYYAPLEMKASAK